MTNVLPFRPPRVKTFCLVCGVELQAIHLIVVIMADEAICAECFAWSGLEMLKRPRGMG